jgi:S-adenosylmethionine:tRNA ribosyltransferase-isomerase
MHPKKLRIQDFTYHLPAEKIATFPARERDASKLLVYRNDQISEDAYRNIAAYLPENALLIFNNTKVIEARLLFQKPTGGLIEIFALEPHSKYKDITTAMQEKASVWWKCLVGGAAKWKDGIVLQKEVAMAAAESPSGDSAETQTGDILLQATIIERNENSFTIEFTWQPANLSFAEVLHIAGVMPLPPYIKREAQQADSDRYQTIYAKNDGSVAAPTAGLHFTEAIFHALSQKNIEKDFVTLHVGAGTFMPVKSERMEGHAMHEEFIDISIDLIKKLIGHPSTIFCVGTTSLRTIESIYWMGVKCFLSSNISYEELSIKQWEVYEELQQHAIENKKALIALLSWMNERQMERLIIKTQILIAPGYTFKMIKGLITNFHQPQSTLLLLVAALIGENWKDVYAYALNNEFRFLSYGDGCLLSNDHQSSPKAVPE